MLTVGGYTGDLDLTSSIRVDAHGDTHVRRAEPESHVMEGDRHGAGAAVDRMGREGLCGKRHWL